MVEFGSGSWYHTPMDRDYGQSRPEDNSTDDVGVGIKDIGMSIGLGPVPNIPAIAAKMRAGTKTMELGFMGAGKGSGQGHTPEYYGKMQRQALVEMQKANQFDFTTHASVGVMGLAGMDQQGNFSSQSREMAVNEIKRAIEFAGDVSQGGPVVVHTGEFQRPLVDSEWNTDGKWKDKFKMYEKEDERASYKVVDNRTGGIIQEARKNRKVARPIWNTAEENKEFKDFDGETKLARGKTDQHGRVIYTDYFGNRIQDENRVPRFSYEKGQFEVTQLGWEDLEKESDQMTLRAKEVWNKWNKSGRPDLNNLEEDNEFRKSYWEKFLKPWVKEDDIKVKPEEAYIISTLETNAANSRGWGYYYGSGFENDVKLIEKLEKALDFYEKLEKATDPEEQWKLKTQLREANIDQFLPSDEKLPSEWIKRELKQRRGHMQQAQEASASQWAQAEEAVEQIRHVETAESYALKESYDAYAQAGIKALMESDKWEKRGKLKNPISVAMENLFPESYGSHPDELMKLVEGSRSRMAQLLKQRGMSEQEAAKKAEDHIYATFDTGHLNMWRKYWQGDPKKNIEQNDKEFDNWMKDKIETMAEKKIIGHLHLVDNYGYQDDHLAPGEGNTPIKDIVRIFKKHGFKGKMIVEPGADWSTDTSGFQSVSKTLKLFGSPVYATPGTAGARDWGQVQHGYVGQNQPPYFTIKPYFPSDDWEIWSGVPLD